MSQQKLNRQAREYSKTGLSAWYDYGSISLHEAARKHAVAIHERDFFFEKYKIEVRCETSPEIPPAVFQVKVELVATVLDPRGETDKEEKGNHPTEIVQTIGGHPYTWDGLGVGQDVGPQKGPSSTAKIQAEQKAVTNELEYLRKRFCDIVPDLSSRSWEDIWERVRDKFKEGKAGN